MRFSLKKVTRHTHYTVEVTVRIHNTSITSALFGLDSRECDLLPSSSSAHYSPLPDIGLSTFSPYRSIFGYSHSSPASCPARIVTPPGLRASCTTFTKTRSPLQNSFTPAVVGSTADMASPLLFLIISLISFN
jgi:hypothetical protein